MHYTDQSRKSMMANRLIGIHSSREKQNDLPKQHPISSIDVGSSCFVGFDFQEHGGGEDGGYRVVEWRKNTKDPIVSVKQYNFSMVKTSSKPIHVPTGVQAEKIIQRLDELKQLTIPESLYVINSLVTGYGAIRKFLGFAAFSLRFCGVNVEGRVKAWINSDFQANDPEGQISSDESELVLKIMQGVKKISAPQFSDFYSYYLRNAGKNICDFKYTYSLLRSYCECTKHKIPSHLDLPYVKSGHHHFNSSCEHGEQMPLKKSSRYSLNPDEHSHKDFSLSLLSGKKNSQGDLQKNFSLKHLNLPFSPRADLKPKEKKSQIQQRAEEQEDTPNNQTDRQPKPHDQQLNPKFSYTSTIIKHSETSTSEHTNSNNKSSLLKNSNQGNDWGFTTFNKLNNFPSSPKSTYKSQNTLKVQGYNQQKVSIMENGHQNNVVRKDKVSIAYRGKSQLKVNDSLQELQEKGEEIIKQNRWNKIEDLFASSELKESRVLGQEPEFAQGSLPSTHKLDRWARVVIKQSNLPPQY